MLEISLSEHLAQFQGQGCLTMADGLVNGRPSGRGHGPEVAVGSGITHQTQAESIQEVTDLRKPYPILITGQSILNFTALMTVAAHRWCWQANCPVVILLLGKGVSYDVDKYADGSLNPIKHSIRKILASMHLEVVAQASAERSRILKNLIDDCDELIQAKGKYGLTQAKYGLLQKGGVGHGTLWLRHGGGYPVGLFSCLTVFMWTILSLQERGDICLRVDNSLGMDSFKETIFMNTWSEMFVEPSREAVDRFAKLSPFQACEFDPHSDYMKIVEDHLGYEWARAFLETYMQPSSLVNNVAESFDSSCRISTVPTICVCYRGTDKHIEVPSVTLSCYFEVVDRFLDVVQNAEVLIQTDQAQAREAFVSRYGRRCKFIAELPVTRGEKAIHNTHAVQGERQRFAVNLYAMCLALSRGRVLVTNSGNVGWFLALHTLIRGNKVIQIDLS